MTQNSTHKIVEIAYLFADIQNHVCALSASDSQIVYLFFVDRLTATDISYICELGSAKVYHIISKFLAKLLSESVRFRASVSLPGRPTGKLCVFREKTYTTDLEDQVSALMTNGQIEDHLMARVIDLVGTAIDIGTPAAPAQLHARIIAEIFGGEPHRRGYVLHNVLSRKP